MRYMLRQLSARIRNRIIVPYLVLALLCTSLGALAAFGIVAQAVQDRLEQQLTDSARNTSQALVDWEDQQLTKLRLISQTLPPDAFGVGRAQLDPVLVQVVTRFQITNVAAFDTSGAIIAQATTPDIVPPFAANTNVRDAEGVAYVLAGRRDDLNGAPADKYTAIIERPNATGGTDAWLSTTVPIRQPGAGDTGSLLGGLIGSSPLSDVVAAAHLRNGAFYTVFHDRAGRVLASSAPQRERDLLMPSQTLQVLQNQPDRAQAVATSPVNQRAFLWAYSPLRIRDHLDGYFGVAVITADAWATWSPTRNVLLGLSLAFLVVVVLVGLRVAAGITRPLQTITHAAYGIAQGRLYQPITVGTHDEIGTLGLALDAMVQRLYGLYRTSREIGAARDPDGVLRAVGGAVYRILPDAHVAAVLPAGDQWAVREINDLHGALLRYWDQAAMDHLALFNELATLPNLLEEVAVRAINARWVLPLRAQQHTFGLLLVAAVPPLTDTASVREPLITIAELAAAALHTIQITPAGAHHEREYTALFESITDGLLFAEPNGAITFANPAAATLLERTAQQLVGTLLAQLPLSSRATDGTQRDNGRQLYQTNQRTLSMITTPVNVDGRFVGTITLIHDLSAQQGLLVHDATT